METAHEEQSSVALIFKFDACNEIRELSKLMPVWVVESIENNLAVVAARRLATTNVTVFSYWEDELHEEMYSRVLYSVSEHHSCDCLLLYGVDIEKIKVEILNELKFWVVEKTEYGCKIRR